MGYVKIIIIITIVVVVVVVVVVGIILMHCFLFEFTLVLTTDLLFSKLLVSEFLLSLAENFLCSMSAVLVKIVLLLDAPQLLMLFVGTLTYMKRKLFLVIVFYNITL
jgi:hypothetical protein